MEVWVGLGLIGVLMMDGSDELKGVDDGMVDV